LGILQVLTGLGVLGGKQWARIVSALFGLVNAIIGTILRILTLLTLGLFSVIVNALLLSITDSLSSNLTIDEFWWTAIWAAIVLAVVTVILQIVVGSLLGGRQAGGY
jgi:putative membrane protein